MSSLRDAPVAPNDLRTSRRHRKGDDGHPHEPCRDGGRRTRSFVVTMGDSPAGVDLTAHITRAADPQSVFAGRGATMHDAVLDVVTELLVEIARRDDSRQALLG